MTEIEKLHEMLTIEKIPHIYTKMDARNYGEDAQQIRVYCDEEKTKEFDDCVFHKYANGYHAGLLESYNLNDCEGYETAEQIFKGWKEQYDRHRAAH